VRVRPGVGGLSAAPGTMVTVRLTGAATYDLEGEVVGARALVDSVKQSRQTSA